MGLIRTLRWIYDDYWRAKRDRWDEDEYVRDEGIAIGEARGRKEGKAESIIQLLKHINTNKKLPQDLTDKIKSEKSNETLDRWFQTAMKAENISDFREKANL